jgi:hypothetical protein
MWEIRWNEDRTEGEIWRMKNWPGFPKAPVREGTITIKRGEKDEREGAVGQSGAAV